MSKFRDIWRSGFVTRYHANPDVPAETLAEHHCRTAQILCAITKPSADLLRYALHHDCAELIVGDLPWPFKRAHPDVASLHADIEAKVLTEMCGSFNLTDREARFAKLADRLAAHLYGSQYGDVEEWTADLARIMIDAHSLDCGRSVTEIIDAATS